VIFAKSVIREKKTNLSFAKNAKDVFSAHQSNNTIHKLKFAQKINYIQGTKFHLSNVKIANNIIQKMKKDLDVAIAWNAILVNKKIIFFGKKEINVRLEIKIISFIVNIV
jgi:hypothetical protein